LLNSTSNIPNMVGAVALCDRDAKLAITPFLIGDFGAMSDGD
jgi:hypothetical protein